MLADDAWIAKIGRQLLQAPETLEEGSGFLPDWEPEIPFDIPPVPAAVLIALVARETGVSVLYTERSPTLRSHSGQVAFPGGKIDPTDTGPDDAALREAYEEVGMDRREAQVLGFMPHYYTGTNYLITPVVALVRPTRPFVPNPSEVDAVFEVPVEKIADLANYGRFRIQRNGVEHTGLQIDHDGHRIWGITANLTRRFRDLALSGAFP